MPGRGRPPSSRADRYARRSRSQRRGGGGGSATHTIALSGPVRRLILAAVAAFDGLLPCPACGVRAAGAAGVCPTCRRRAFRPGREAGRLWLGAYDGPLGRLVRALKYRGATRLGGWLGVSLGTEAGRAGWRPGVVCAVPLHPSRKRERGYNQAELLARGTARLLGVPYRPLLRRTRPTLRQARLDRSARRDNVAGAFASLPLHGESVLLVDDVLTTGATAEACRSALLAAGAGMVWVAVVARSTRPARHPPDGLSDGEKQSRRDAHQGAHQHLRVGVT